MYRRRDVIDVEAAAKRSAPLEKPNIVWDLDGVLAEQAWPEIGKPIPWAVELFKECQQAGHLCIIYTSRDGWHLPAIRDFCNSWGIVPDEVVTGKPLGILIDDLAVNPGSTQGLGVRSAIGELCRKMQRLWNANLEGAKRR